MQPPPSCNVYTPTSLASAIVHSLGDRPASKWLEPCVGQGAFLAALSRRKVDVKRIRGIDLSSSSEPTDKLARVSRSTEFLDWAARTTSRFDRVVANPPFISLSKSSKKIRVAALRHAIPGGDRVTLRDNCWSAFLCASLRVLKPGGSLAFVLPAAYEYANYAGALRSSLREKFATLEVHRCRVPIFELVQDGSVVVIARNYQAKPSSQLNRHYDTLRQLVAGIRDSNKGAAVARVRKHRPQSHSLVALREVMSIGIGAVTGDVHYFLMNEDERIARSIPIASVCPIVSKSRHLAGASINREQWGFLRDNGERVWLFRPKAEQIGVPAVRRYLKLDESEGGCRKTAYKVRSRYPWFRTSLPTRPQGFMSGMCQSGPFVCFNQMRGLSTINTLYTVRFNPGLTIDMQCAWSLMLFTSEVRKQLENASRKYALGLSKYEPGDLSALMVPKPRYARCMREVYADAVGALLVGNRRYAEGLANKFVCSS